MLLNGLQKVLDDSILILGRRKFGEVFGDGDDELALAVGGLHPELVDLFVRFQGVRCDDVEIGNTGLEGEEKGWALEGCVHRFALIPCGREWAARMNCFVSPFERGQEQVVNVKDW